MEAKIEEIYIAILSATLRERELLRGELFNLVMFC